ncbi:hypothetical protein [Psychrobacter sp. PAMC 21119]|uniref:hypothetical protein n=1 Tax=Psychrobacter sp. PAMC 21119 TaxID=1112209 RepID=UPI00028997F2|nr:hypothetical protein [Psychrobacter sp. PAMC 21119]
MNNSPLPDDMWAAARLIWENTIKITDAELIEQLEVKFKDDVPKSTGTISKRRKKEEWAKNTLAEAGKRVAEQSITAPVGNNFGGKRKNIPPKTNKAQKVEKSGDQEERKGIIDGIMNEVVLDAKGRASIIHKYRRRYVKAGELFDQALEVTLSIKEQADEVDQLRDALLEEADSHASDFEIGENGKITEELEKKTQLAMEKVQKSMVLSKALTDTALSLATGLKMLSEVDMPMCGITAEDFKESAQDRRLGALALLGDIDKKEKEARDRLVPELHDQLRAIEEIEASADFGRGDWQDDEEIDDVDYTTID